MNTVTVVINGIEYNLRGKEDERYLSEVAAYVDTKIREISGSNKKLSTSSAAVLTAVNIADELFKCDLEIGNITKKKNSLEERHLTLKERLRELKVEIDETAKARASEVESLKSVIFDMESKLKELESYKLLSEELTEKVKTLTEINNNNETQISELNKELLDLQSTNQKLEDKVKSCTDEINNRVSISEFEEAITKLEKTQKINLILSDENDDLKEKTLGAMNIVILTMPVMSLFMNITSCAVVWFGGNQIIAGSMQVGDLTAFITYVTQILMSLMMLAMIILQSSRSMASFHRTSELLDFETKLNDEKSASKDKKVENGIIEFKNVYFRYTSLGEDTAEIKDKTGTNKKNKKTNRSAELDNTAANVEGFDAVLSDISFVINKGETVGIIGPTGCGKTSLVQLIPRFYDVSSGSVLVDGTDVRDYSLKNLRDGVGMVLQYNTLFAGTIYENLRWGDENASDEEVRRYAGYAQADGFIGEFTDGYDTMIEQGGSNVSGGQKQRLCIARALLKKPKILILDDSTSAVDTATEKRINEAFADELKDTTKLIIAQRIGSVINTDRIIVMDDGKITAIGTHAELMDSCKEYQEIYYSQMEKKTEATA